MRNILLAKLAAFVLVMTPSLASGACNLGEDANKMTTINFGRLKLYDFPLGSLQVETGHALADGDSWPFMLKVPNNRMGFSVTAPSSDMASALSLDGTVQLVRPIKGFIVERITQGECQRELRVEDNVLAGASIRIRSGTAGNSFGGKISLSGLTLKVEHQINLTDRKGQTRGLFVLSGQNIKIAGAQVSLPASNGLRIPVTFKTSQANRLVFELPLDTLTAKMRTGTIQSDPITMAPSNGLEFALWELHIIVSKYRIASITAKFANSAADLSFDGWTLTASQVSFLSQRPAQVRNIKALTIGSIHGKNDTAISGALALSPDSITLQSANIVADSFSLFSVNGHALISGGGQAILEKFSKNDFDCNLIIDRPLTDPLPGVAFSYSPSSIKLFAHGPKTDITISSQGILSALALGTFKLSNGTIPFKFSNGQGNSIEVQIDGGKGSITLGSAGPQQITGMMTKLSLTSSLSGYDNGDLRLAIPADRLLGDFSPAPFQTPVMGGNLSLRAQTLHIRNAFSILIGSNISGGQLSLGSPVIALSNVQVRPRHSSDGIPVQSTESEATASDLSFDVAVVVSSPLLINASFDLPGFEIRPPPPISSITFEIGGFDVEVTSFKVDKFHVELTGPALRATLVGLSIGVGQFSPKPPDAGKTVAQPNLKGVASRPFAIDQASAVVKIIPLPPSLGEFDITGLTFGASQLAYVGPSDLKATSGSAEINISSFSVERKAEGQAATIDGSITLTNTNVEWWGTPNGVAAVENLTITLHGDPAAPIAPVDAEKPDGKLSLKASQLALSGKMNIPLGTKPDGTHGCSLVVPANGNLSLHNLFGTLNISKGKANGVIEADGGDPGEFSYDGYQECRFNQPLKLASITQSYPCFGTWKDPVRTCTVTIAPTITVGMVFWVRKFDILVEPYKTFFNIEDGGKVGACSISLNKMYPKEHPLFSISPQLPVGGDGAKIVNDLTSFAVGVLQSVLTGHLLDLYSAMTLLGFGKANPVQGNNCPSS
jgi:hypothetical protein